MRPVLALLLLVGCSGGDGGKESEDPPLESLGLEARFLAVGGWYLKVGEDAVVTPPMFTNPSIWDMSLGEIWPEQDPVDRFLGDISDARAVLVGHGHYDHLLDAPYVRSLTADATIYGNRSVQWLLAGFAPDPDGSCPVDTAAPEPWAEVPRDRVVALNAPGADLVDYRSCGGVETCTPSATDQAGAWVQPEGSGFRFKAICSKHAPQYGDLHFGDGCVTSEPCGPVRLADDWREGTTLAYLVDFLDADGEIAVRIYYHDAPADPPIGFPHASDLAERPVDVALLNAGNYEQVANYPDAILDLMQPRYVFLGHWENFFRTLDEAEALYPLPGLDLETLHAKMEARDPDGEGVQWWIPDPGESFDL